MPLIRILPHAEYCPQGDTIEAPAGTSICEALLENGIAIEHACEMSCACTTWGLTPTSRLSCQAILSDQDVTIEIPKYSINHAKENH